ncbi:cytochrome P450 [Aspergillus desertorum]
MLESSTSLLAGGILAPIVSRLLYNLFQPGLVGIPGPLPARYTDLCRLYKVWQWKFKEDLPALHKAYNSTVIRVGPRMVSCSDPRAVELIYGFHTDFKKSDMVKAMAPIYKGKRQPTMFAAADNKTHVRIRKPVAGAYAMSNELFIQPQRPCDIHNWVQYFAFDTVLEMTMSRNLGFMKAGGDVEGVLKQLQKDLDYRGIDDRSANRSWALAMPIIDRIWRLNPLSKLFKPNQSSHFAMRCKRILEDRIEQEKLNAAPEQPDFARRFLEAQRRDPSISDGQLIGYMQANLITGSDTTAVAMRTAIYYTLKNPWIHSRLVDELDSYSNLPIPVPFRIARFKLPFCAAVIRESLRKHFAFIGMMERETPPTGVQLPDGHVPPGRVVIGMHGDLIGRDRGIFGDDADGFNPLRWLPNPGETETDFQARLRVTNAHDLAFGHGPRGCIGKHVAEMEIYKFVPTFFALVKPGFVHPERSWTLRQLFVFKQGGLDMKLGWRKGRGVESIG